MFKGRYLNGEAYLKASFFDGELIVHMEEIEVKGKKPPEDAMKGFGSKTWPRTFSKILKMPRCFASSRASKSKTGKSSSR